MKLLLELTEDAQLLSATSSQIVGSLSASKDFSGLLGSHFSKSLLNTVEHPKMISDIYPSSPLSGIGRKAWQIDVSPPCRLQFNFQRNNEKANISDEASPVEKQFLMVSYVSEHGVYQTRFLLPAILGELEKLDIAVLVSFSKFDSTAPRFQITIPPPLDSYKLKSDASKWTRTSVLGVLPRPSGTATVNSGPSLSTKPESSVADGLALIDGESPVQPATSLFPVWYATNRKGFFDVKGVLTGFSAQRGENVSYGKCLVDIPESHEIGKTKSALWRRLLFTLTFQKDTQALSLFNIEAQEAGLHWSEMQDIGAKWTADERCAVVFLHGYNVSFEEAAIRAAQIGYDLQVRGPVGFFSWPSKGTLIGYPADESAIEASEDEITEYLRDFVRNSGAERIYVIAHSMGNRGLLRALQRIVADASSDCPKLFEQFILAAPDVDQSLFLSLASNYSRLAHRTTLYVSDKDLALASSSLLRTGTARAGLTPPITIAPQIDTVHVANVDMTLLGHGYVAEARDVLTDMHQLLYQNAPPEMRMGLRPAQDQGHRYWVIGA
jgi:esterase/lipase superfamily enzyme